MHSLEIIELQFEKERHTLLCILELFTNTFHELSLKNVWLPTIRGKNTFELVSNVLELSQKLCSH